MVILAISSWTGTGYFVTRRVSSLGITVLSRFRPKLCSSPDSHNAADAQTYSMSSHGSNILRQRTPQPPSPPDQPGVAQSQQVKEGMLPVPPSMPSSGLGSAGPAGQKRPNITDFTISLDEVDGRAPGAEGSAGARGRASLGREPGPPKWRTKVFMLYGLVFALVVPILVYWPMRLSQCESRLRIRRRFEQLAEQDSLSPELPDVCAKALAGVVVRQTGGESPSVFNHSVLGTDVGVALHEHLADLGQDSSDPQYRTFRNNLLPLVLLASTYLIASSAQRRLYPSASHRAFFIAVFSTIMLFALHGVSAVKIFAILYINYLVSTAPKPPAVARVWPALLIAGNMVLLFLNERYDGYKLGGLHAFFEPIVRVAKREGRTCF